MTLRECYEAIGSDYDAAIGRMLNKESLMKKIVLMFLRDPNYSRMVSAMAEGDCKAASEASHTLKGASLNLGFDRLGELSHRVTELLRAEKLEEAKQLAETLKDEYERVIGTISRYQSELEE